MINAPSPPPAALAVLREQRAGDAREDAIHVAPHQVFTAMLTDVREGRVLANAQETAWRDVAGGTAAEVSSRNGEFVITSINEGPFVAATADALGIAKQLDGDYELRVLTIPAVYVVALWLYAASGSVLIPLAPAPSGLTANQPYDETSFTAALHPLAEKRSTTPMV
jgi:hypothetical protein